MAIVQCYEDKTETADAAIDAAQQASFATASAAQQAAMNTAGQAWLAARPTVCAKAYNTGGTINQVNIASCLLDESTARLGVLGTSQPSMAVLKSTDSQSPSDISWYTTPEGSRIGLVDTQGDATGGVIIAWTIIAGASGFVVNPAQFLLQRRHLQGRRDHPEARPERAPGGAGDRVHVRHRLQHAVARPEPDYRQRRLLLFTGRPAAVWR